MSSQMIDIQTADGVANAYLATPDSEGPHPGVLLIMDAFGLRAQIERMADRIAARGYVVLAPNLFYRSGRDPVGGVPDLSSPGAREAFFKFLGPIRAALTPAAVARDGDAYLSRLQEECDGPVAITGYCMGGVIGLRIAAAHPDRVVALGGFHVGRLVTGDPDSPHLSVGRVAAELYFGFADNDESMTAQDIAEFERALAQAGVEYRAEVYEGAAHGYTMTDMAVYDEAAAERHYEELFALLGRARS